MKTIFLIMIGLSVSTWADFTKEENTVTDNITGLQWQDDARIGTHSNTWKRAIDRCEALSLDGFNDWRLPNLNELTSLVDYSRTNPAIDPTFQRVVARGYWSSTTYAGFASSAWVVYFRSGGQGNSSKGYSKYVRCVRAGE